MGKANRIKITFKRPSVIHDELIQRGRQHHPITESMPRDLSDQQCGARTRAGTPCKQKAIYNNGRCKWHGGCSTGAKTPEGKKRSSMNGFCPKNRLKSAGFVTKTSDN